MAEVKKTVKKASKPKVSKEEASQLAPKRRADRDDNSFAVIETGGKQYRVQVGDTVTIEKLIDKEYKVGDVIAFDKVLLVDNGSDVTDIGTPYLAGAKVMGTIAAIGRNAKITVIKYKQKSRYFKKNGHRQPHFKVTIDKIA